MPRFLNNKKRKTEDIDFWEKIIAEEEKERMSERSRNINSKKGIKVVIDAAEGVAAVGDRKNDYWATRVPFKGTTVRGKEERLFSRKSDKALKEEILNQYIKNQKYMSKYRKSRIIKKINKNVDLKVYKILKDYDFSNYSDSKKSQEYVNAMISYVRVKNKRTDNTRQRARNEEIARKEALKKAGITISYDLRNVVFNKNNPIDNIKVLINGIKYRKFAEVKLPGFTINPRKRKIRKVRKHSDKKVIRIKKKQKQLVPLKLKKLNKNKNYKSKKSLINEFKNKVSQKNWSKELKRGLVAAGIIGLVGLAGVTGFSSGTKKIDTTKTNGKTIETVGDNQILNLDVNKPILDTKEFKIVGLSDKEKTNQEIIEQFSIQKILEEKKEEQNFVKQENITQSNVEEKDEQVNNEIQNNDKIEEDIVEQNEEKVILKDALIEALGLGFDTEFSMGSGRYYEAPGKTGRSGGYSNISNKIKINYVDAIEDGNYYKYAIEDGKSIADIKKEHPNAKLSYHVVTNSGMVLGWNDSTENDIEVNMIKGALMAMKPYIASETMEYLCANDLNGEVSSKEFSEYIQELQEAQAQAKEGKDLGKSVKER